MQTFRGKTLQEAKRAAEAELGAEAIVVTARQVPRTGIGGLLGAMDVEIAAMTPEPDPIPTDKKKGPFSQDAYRATASTQWGTPQRKNKPDSDPPRQNDVLKLRRELFEELKSLQNVVARSAISPSSIEAELSSLREAIDLMQVVEQPPAAGRIGKLLRETAIEGRGASAILRAIKGNGGESDEERLRDAIADQIRATPWPLASSEPAIIAVVGPTGVGKTTTAAKIAARAILTQQRSVTFVSSDGHRVGAIEQLARFADLLGAGMEIARTKIELERIVERAKTDLVIIDTGGSPAPREGAEAALAFLGRGKAIATNRERFVLLCATASTRAVDAESFARIYAKAMPTALAITKLDETRTPAGIVHASVAAKLPVAVLANGPRVPEDIAPATMGAMLDALCADRSPKPAKAQRRGRGSRLEMEEKDHG
jgi:flagellar biosynthesis protein FlhF